MKALVSILLLVAAACAPAPAQPSSQTCSCTPVSGNPPAVAWCERDPVCAADCRDAWDFAIDDLRGNCETCCDGCDSHYIDDLNYCQSVFGQGGSNPNPTLLAECLSAAGDEHYACKNGCNSTQFAALQSAKSDYSACMAACCE